MYLTYSKAKRMNKKIEQILDKRKEKLILWADSINENSKLYTSNKEYNLEERTEITRSTANTLGDISGAFFEYGSFKDQFDNESFYYHVYGPELIIKSIKTETTYYFGIDDRGIYLRTYLKHVENIPYMNDSFWKDLLNLDKYGKFELLEFEHFGSETTSKYPAFFNYKKSVLYRIFRNYFVASIENSNVVPGELHIYWGPDTSFDQIIYNSCLVFKTLYNLNYSLWKVEGIRQKTSNT